MKINWKQGTRANHLETWTENVLPTALDEVVFDCPNGIITLDNEIWYAKHVIVQPNTTLIAGSIPYGTSLTLCENASCYIGSMVVADIPFLLDDVVIDPHAVLISRWFMCIDTLSLDTECVAEFAQGLSVVRSLCTEHSSSLVVRGEFHFDHADGFQKGTFSYVDDKP